MKKVKFLKSKLGTGEINIPVEATLRDLGNSDYETENASVIHIFEIVPFIRRSNNNSSWFSNWIYHKQII